MATVAKSNRSTTITLASASAGPFDLTFRLFDNDGLNVYVNGLPRTDFTIQSNYTDGFDDNATITFNSSLAISDVIIIDSFLAAQRGEDYLDGPGLTNKLNIEFARLWSGLSDVGREVKRSLRFLKGTTASDIAVGKSLIVTATGIGEGPTATEITNAQGYANAAAVSAAAAASSFDSFDDKFLGIKASNPTVDNDGDPLEEGALYVNSTDGLMYIYLSSAWVAVALSAAQFMTKAANLSDLASAATSRSNLGLGDAATTSASAYATAAQGTTADAAVPSPASPANGDILIRSGGAWNRLPKGSDGQQLQLVSGIPAWVTNSYKFAECLSSNVGVLTENTGISTVTFPAVGVAEVTLATAFSNTRYRPIITLNDIGNTGMLTTDPEFTKTTTKFRFRMYDHTGSPTSLAFLVQLWTPLA
jgi:hypothetical protein